MDARVEQAVNQWPGDLREGLPLLPTIFTSCASAPARKTLFSTPRAGSFADDF